MYEYHRKDEAKVACNRLTVCKGGMEAAEVLVTNSLYVRPLSHGHCELV